MTDNNEKVIPNVDSKSKEERNVPDLGIMTELKNVADIFDGTHQTPEYKDSGIPFVSVENIDDIYNYNKFISIDAYTKEFSKNHPEQNDILMTRIGDIGTPAFVTRSEDMGYYVSLALLKPKNINNKYLYYYIQTSYFQHELWKKTIHVAFPKKINKEDIGECKIFLPGLPYQNKIVPLFDKLEARIMAQKKIIEDLIVLNKAIINKMKSKSVLNQPIKLTDIANYYNGVAHEDDVDENGYTLINSKFISSDGEIQKFCKTARFPLKKNDICLVLSDLPNGKALAKCFYVDEDNKYTLNQRIACIRSKDLLLSKYLYYYINRNSYFLKYDDGVNQTNLSKNAVTKFMIRIHNSYQKYVSLLDDVNIKITNEKKILSLYIKQKQYLLNKMFI